MSDLQKIEQQYIVTAKLHSQASAEGDYKVANKQYNILKNIYKKIEDGVIDKTILLNLLDNEDISVEGWAAAHLLGLKYEIKKAEMALERIKALQCKGVRDNLEIFAAEKTLEVWRKQGYLKF